MGYPVIVRAAYALGGLGSGFADNDEELRRREQAAPGVEHDVVAIYDNAGIPSIMHRFRRVTNKELFGGSDAVHPAFIIGGQVYDLYFCL